MDDKKDIASVPADDIDKLKSRFVKAQATLQKNENELADIARKLRKARVDAVVPKKVAMDAAAKMGPMDDPFFTKLAEDPGAIEEVIGAALGIKVTVQKVIPQYTIPGFGTRGVRLDSFSVIVPAVAATVKLGEGCELGPKGALVDIEIQKEDRKDTEYRVYFNGASIIVNNTPPGIDDYRQIPRAVVIWISEKDPFGKGKMYYQSEKRDMASGDPMKSPVTEIFINTENMATTGDSKLDRIARLMKIFKEPDEYDFTEFPKFSKKKQQLKTTAEGVLDVGKEYQQIIDNEREEARTEGKAEGRAEGRAEGKKETADLMAFLAKNNRTEDILKASTDTGFLNKLLDSFKAGLLTNAATTP